MLLLFAIVSLIPPAAVVRVFTRATRLRKRDEVSRNDAWVAYALGALGALLSLRGLVAIVTDMPGMVTDLSGEAIDPTQKARALAETISMAMNCGAVNLLALPCAVLATAWLRFRQSRRTRSR